MAAGLKGWRQIRFEGRIRDDIERFEARAAGQGDFYQHHRAMKRRIMDMGVTPGVEIRVVKVAPLGDPVEVNVRGYELSLRKDEAAQIQVQM